MATEAGTTPVPDGGRRTVDLPGEGRGAWLLAAEPGLAWGDDEPEPYVDLGWSADGTREGYRHAGTFRTMREADLALAAFGRRVGSGEFADLSAFLEAKGFSCPPPRGLSVSGRGSWQKEIDERWFAYFLHDDMNGTDLRIVDRAAPVYTQAVTATINPPCECRAWLPRRGVAVEEALLAILEARLETENPMLPIG